MSWNSTQCIGAKSYRFIKYVLCHGEGRGQAKAYTENKLGLQSINYVISPTWGRGLVKKSQILVYVLFGCSFIGKIDTKRPKNRPCVITQELEKKQIKGCVRYFPRQSNIRRRLPLVHHTNAGENHYEKGQAENVIFFCVWCTPPGISQTV